MSAASYYNTVQNYVTGYNKLPDQGPGAYNPEPNAPFIAPEPYESGKQFNNTRKSTFAKWSHRVRIIIIVSTVCTALFTLFMGGVMVYMLERFFSTHNKQVNGRGPWSKNTQMWPTWLLFSASAVTLAITMFSLCLLCCSKKAQKSKRIWLTVIKYSIHIFAWAAVAIFYKVGKTGDDLWGWSCSEKAALIQPDFPELHFQTLCNIQSGSWYFTIVEVSVKITFAIVHYWFYRKDSDAKWKLGGKLGDIGMDQINIT